jgi:hypothetical protein
MILNIQNPAIFPLFFVCLWVSIGFVVSLTGGWFELGRVYRAVQPFQGQCWRFQNAQLRWLMRYNHALTVGADTAGLYMSVFPLFRVGHPPLFIPWQDISVRPGKYLWVRVYKFEFRQVPSVCVQLRESLAKKIEMAAASAWPGDRSATGAAF